MFEIAKTYDIKLQKYIVILFGDFYAKLKTLNVINEPNRIFII